jgi:hypothetical protein
MRQVKCFMVRALVGCRRCGFAGIAEPQGGEGGAVDLLPDWELYTNYVGIAILPA